MEINETIKQWLNGVKIAHICHKKVSTDYKKKAELLGITATSLAIIVGAGIFTMLSSSTNMVVLIVTGIISLLSALCSGLNTYLDLPEKSNRHRNSSIEYGNLRREIEEMMTYFKEGKIESLPLGELREKWNGIEVNAPEIPQKTHNEVLRSIKKA